jgi:hypothetical protein
MPAIVNYRSRFGPHLSTSELCAACHTLFTPVLDQEGNPSGSFPEQTPYLEWKNSIHAVRGTQCQDCHMPALPDSIKISGMGDFPKRAPYNRHEFVGGNVYMLTLLRGHIDSLGITSSAAHFDSTIARATRSLTERSVDVSMTADVEDESLKVRVTVKNLTGHKLPTGIPLRRMWIRLTIVGASGDTVFESGGWDASGRLVSQGSPYEPHHRVITSEGQVQIYEAVTGDTDGRMTRSLLRAAMYLKDNRLPPEGFTSAHPAYDSTAIAGDALTDTDFNRDGMAEGTGSDVVTYMVPLPAPGTLRASAEICFQTVTPELVDELRQVPAQDAARFVRMHDRTPNVPFIMKRATADIVTGVAGTAAHPQHFRLLPNFPNPFNPSTEIAFDIPPAPGSDGGAPGSDASLVRLSVHDMLGREVAVLANERLAPGHHSRTFSPAGLPSGVYLYRLTVGRRSAVGKMLLVR